MSKQDNIYNLAGHYNSRLHISNFIEPLIKPLKKKYGVKVDELSILWDQVFEGQYKDQVYPKKISTEYRFINGEKKIYRKLHLEVSGSSAIEMQYRRNSIINRVNEIYGQNFISDLVIKNKPDKNKINYKDTASNNIASELPCLTSHEAQAEKSKNLEDALAKLGKNIKEKRRNEKK
ncbi:MAG: hypothetical protein CML28_02700 [Rhizobiales bacterium]|nr:hypothetical protein [Hyphomicrobiales bacterium]|tara:strand:- start:3235 stop:3765 length:531 start_codon:yes stop_codon:yes gene_type:complete